MFLAGCSVRPLHDNTMDTNIAATSSTNISVDTIAEREGQKLRSHLIDAFRDIRFAKKNYRLTVTLKVIEREFAIGKDGNAKRVLFTYAAFVILRDHTGKNVMEREINASTSYNIGHSHGEVTLSLYGRHNDHLLRELSHRIVENVRMALEE